MRLLKFILVLISLSLLPMFSHASSCDAISTDNSSYQQFNLYLKKSCEELSYMCLVSPQNRFCPMSDKESRISDHEKQRLQNKYTAYLYQSTANLFSFESILDLDDKKRARYFDKLKIVDELSRNQDPLIQALVTTWTIHATLKWSEMFDDPLRDQNVYSPESKDSARAATELSAQAQGGAFIWTAFAGMGASLIGGKLTAKLSQSLINKGKFAIVGLAFKLPRPIYTELLYAMAPGMAVQYRHKPTNLSERLIESPAHMVRFDMTESFDLSEYDMKAEWLQIEAEIYEQGISGSTFFGSQMFFAYLGGKLKPGIFRTLLNGPDNIRLLKGLQFFRFTPAGMIAGYTLEKAVSTGLSKLKLSELETNLDIAVWLNNPEEVYEASLLLIRHFHEKALFIRNEMKVKRAFDQYAKNPTDHDALKLFSHYLSPFQYPYKTRAHFYKEKLCYGLTQEDYHWLDHQSIVTSAYNQRMNMRHDAETGIEQVKEAIQYFETNVLQREKVQKHAFAQDIIAAQISKLEELVKDLASFKAELSEENSHKHNLDKLKRILEHRKPQHYYEFFCSVGEFQ